MQVAQDWRSRAVCRDEDPELFFPVAEPGTKPYERQVAEAKKVCAGCPVRAECLAWALEAELSHGIAGGLDEHERRNARKNRSRRRRRAAASAPDPALVERLARHGRPKGEMSTGERRALRAAALVMAEAGSSVPAIAERMNVTERTVERWLATAREEADGGAAA